MIFHHNALPPGLRFLKFASSEGFQTLFMVFDLTGNHFPLHIIARFILVTSYDYDMMELSNIMDKGWFE